MYDKDKENARAIVRSRLLGMDSIARDNLSRIICDKALNMSEYINSESIFIYKSMPYEVNTDIIINDALERNKKVYVPYTNGDIMYAVRVDKQSFYVLNKYSIYEPLNTVERAITTDIAFIPLLAYDNNMSRLGHGKGYYDKYLADKDIYKVALAFSIQQMPHIPTSEYDLKMDKVITEL